MSMTSTSTGEYCVQMPEKLTGAGEEGKGAKPEKLLNSFVRCIALIERLGNALGTLAFTWATVVLLGGYPTVLHPLDDFWFATTIVFLEAARMFSRNNRLDYQLFFNTRGAFRPLGWNGLIAVVLFTSVFVFLINYIGLLNGLALLILMVGVLVVYRFLIGWLIRLLSCNLLHRAISIWSPLLPIIFMGLSVLKRSTPNDDARTKLTKDELRHNLKNVEVVVFLLLFTVLLLLSISRLQFQSIRNLVGRALGSKQEIWHRVILSLCMLATGVMLVFMHDEGRYWLSITIIEVSAVAVLSLGNLQIPAAIVRIVLGLVRLVPHDYCKDSEKNDDCNNIKEKMNLAPSLNIFYGMVLVQGTLYAVACMLELSSSVPRRYLVHRAGFNGQWGLDSVNMYYAYALDKCMEKDILTPKKISLVSFAMSSLKSDSTKRQFNGIRILHSLLQIEPTRIDIVSKLNASTKKMAKIIKMLDWTQKKDVHIRIYAAKVFCEIAKSFRLATVPGTVQLISTLLDTDSKPGRETMLFDMDDENEGKEERVTDTINSQENPVSVRGTYDNRRGQGQESVHHDTSNLVETQARSHHQSGYSDLKSCIIRCWKRIKRFWSIPQDEQLTDQDDIPALGMSILCSLAYYDQDNCMVMSRTVDLIPKIIWFTSYRNMQNTNEVQQEILMGSSLKLLQKLSNTSGQIGMTLRCAIGDDPVLLSNLRDILDGNSQELKKNAIIILRNLAIDENISQEIGRIQMVICRLMDAFLSGVVSSSTNADSYLQKVAGQALVILTMERADNCAALVTERGNLIGELASMICESNHTYVVAKLLKNLLVHTQPVLLSDSNKRKICEALPKVLETCMDAQPEEAELEVLIGLSSQICKVIPDDFGRELEKCQTNETFVMWLLETLKAHMVPAVHCPEIRRAVVEHTIHLMKYSSQQYANLFSRSGMIEVLSMVKHTPSRVDRYKIFMGPVGLMEHKEPLINLVKIASELIYHERLRSIRNAG